MINIENKLKELITDNRNLIYSIIHKFRSKDVEDLFQVGCIGLIKAYNNFDSTMNVKFTSYAYNYILGEIYQYIINNQSIRMSPSNIKLANSINKAEEYLTSHLNRKPTIIELCSFLEIEPYKYEEIKNLMMIDNIDILNLKNKYEADNIIFIYFFNTDNTNSAITSTYNLDIDIVNVFPENNEYIIPPATYAHELLHTFGAPDLYFENRTINQEYVDYLLENDSDDIMFKVTDTSVIIDDFSDLDAYYVGLIDSHPDIEKWNLGLSEHLSTP